MPITVKSFFIILSFLTLSTFFYTHHDIKKNHYVGSEACASCHADYYQAWKQQTLHSRMFRPVETEDDIQGDFSKSNPVVTFKKEDIEFVLGNKWEQAYVRLIDGEYYPLPAKWLITTQKWEAYKVDNWKQTPMSTQCNGCHTTGFNQDTYEFSEFSIGCDR